VGYEHIKVSPGAVAEVTLARPEARNAMSEVTLGELERAFRELAKAPDLRAVVVSGEGKDFCAGADIDWMRRGGTLPADEGKKDARRFADMLFAVDECPVPVIVAAHGNVFGGGLGLLAAADVALLADEAKLCFSEVRLGIMPAVISSWVLPKIGVANARRYYLTAELFSAAQAVAMGLAHETVPATDLRARALKLAADVLKNGPLAVRTAKAAIPKIARASIEERVDLTVDTLVRLRSGPEGQEGLSAFLEKRPAKWTVRP
jgi:methylglutaconyl-CoA hydratase